MSDRVNGRGQVPLPTKQELEDAGIRIVVGIPMERYVQDVAFLQFWKIASKGWPIVEHYYGRTDKNRNMMAKALLESDFTHIMMMDLDHIHPVNVVERHAVHVLHDPNKLIVGGIHFRRGTPYDPCVFVYGQDGKLHAPMDWDSGVGKVDAIGHGTILIHRSVFETLDPPWWAYTYMGNHHYPSEDMFFCKMCGEHGIDIWCDTTITSPHLIQSTVDESSFREWVSDHPIEVQKVTDGNK